MVFLRIFALEGVVFQQQTENATTNITFRRYLAGDSGGQEPRTNAGLKKRFRKKLLFFGCDLPEP
jgi:hypothetical protein